MTSSDRIVIRVLLLVAKLIAKDDWKKDIESLATHIAYSSEAKNA